MNRLRLILRSLAYFRRTHAGVVAGAAVTAAVLTGALVVGDSVSHTLRRQAELRIGNVEHALVLNDRMFSSDLAERISTAESGVEAAPVLFVRGVVSTPDGSRTAQQVNILGVDERFFDLAPDPGSITPPTDGRAWINNRLATQLQSETGQQLVVRVGKPSALPRDSVLGTIQDMSLALRVTVEGIAGADSFGRFSLQANQIPPHNMFVPLVWLQQQIETPDRANALLARSANGDVSVGQLNAALREVLVLDDLQLSVRSVPDSTTAELISERIFISPVEEGAIQQCESSLIGVLTYFVNGIAHGERTTPYSIVAAIGPLREQDSWPAVSAIPGDLAANDIVINPWLATDLNASTGDSLTLTYFALEDETERLVERSADFTVRAIVPISGLAADRTLMPEFPGIADAESSRAWEPGIPIDLGRIRDTDEDYWDTYRGTPKAFIGLERGRELWRNRYGGLTAVRFEAEYATNVQEATEDAIDPADLGFTIRDVRTPAVRASQSTTDFGGLFLGLSIFLIAAALLLTGLLFALNIDQRSREIGTLLAVGFTPRDVRRQLTVEGGAIALIGAIIGTGIGVAYTLVILAALRNIWSEAVASADISLAITPASLAIGAVSTVLVSVIAMWLTLGYKVKQPPTDLIGRGIGSSAAAHERRFPVVTLILAVVLIAGAVVMALVSGADQRQASLVFFGAGALILIGGLGLSRVLLILLRNAAADARPSFGRLALRNTTRRAGRSLTTISLLACGVFLVLAVAANRLDAQRDAESRDSGTGGFAFYGESTIPLVYDLNEQRGRDAFGLTADELNGVSFVSMRLQEGDDASCLNLNTAQRPRLLGVDPDALASRGSFTFVKTHPDLDPDAGWNLLEAELPGGAAPAVVDDASATWALHKSIGDTIVYTDDRGEPFEVMIAGTIDNSILQGSLLISDEQFRRRFPSQTGAQAFLIDAPPSPHSTHRRDELAARLQQAMSDVGLELSPAARRLAEFNAVQNSYLAIFQLLGGLGLLLGSVGLGLIVVRNILERRSEMALLRAVGFEINAVRALIRREHVVILLLGIAVGAVAALIALIPAFRSPTAELPYGLMAILLALLLANGIFWVWLATRLTISGELMAALRDE